MLIKLPELFNRSSAKTVYDEMVDAASIDGYVIIDGSVVREIDIHGARSLLDALCFAGIVGAEFEVVEVSDTMRAFLELTRINYLLPACDEGPSLEQTERKDRTVVARFVIGLFVVTAIIATIVAFSGLD